VYDFHAINLFALLLQHRNAISEARLFEYPLYTPLELFYGRTGGIQVDFHPGSSNSPRVLGLIHTSARNDHGHAVGNAVGNAVVDRTVSRVVHPDIGML
jgi:hypothetical protein